MALARRNQRMNTAIWPGFVDAMTGLLLVLMFVLTIFMVIQFVLRETITGQESELDLLAEEVAALNVALGLSEDRRAALSADLATAADEATAQAALIARLTTERDSTAAALVAAQNQITGFEAQVAGLLADRFGRKPVIQASVALYVVGALISAAAPSLGLLLLSRLLWGIASAGPRVVAFAVIRDTFSGEAMSRAMSLLMAVSSCPFFRSMVRGETRQAARTAGCRGIFVRGAFRGRIDEALRSVDGCRWAGYARARFPNR